MLPIKRFKGPSVRRSEIWTASVRRRHNVVQSRTAQSRFAISSRLATMPVICRSGGLNRTVIVKAELDRGIGEHRRATGPAVLRRQPRPPPCPAGTASETRLRSAAVQWDKFVVP